MTIREKIINTMITLELFELRQLISIFSWDLSNKQYNIPDEIRIIIRELLNMGFLSKDAALLYKINNGENILKYYKRQERLELILEESV
jgi:hypothetical protein